MWSVTALHVTASLQCPVGCPSVNLGAAKPQLSLLELEMLDTASQKLEHPRAFLCLSFLSLHWVFLTSFLLGQEITGSRGWSTTKIELYFGTSAIRAGSFGPGVAIQVWQRPPRTPAAVPGTHTGLSLCHGEHVLCHSPELSRVTAHHCPGAMAAGPVPSAGLSPSLPRMPVCSELGGVGTAVGAEGHGGDKDDTGSTTSYPMGLS